MHIKSFTFNHFYENTYVMSLGTHAIIIDPGCYTDDEKHILDEYITKNDLKPVAIINTHCHIDHVVGNYHCKTKYKIPLYIHKLEIPILKAAEVLASSYGFIPYHHADETNYINENEQLKFIGINFDVLWVPGHAPGHVAFVHHASGSVLSGDVIFYESIGRTDIPYGNYNDLTNSILQKLYKLPPHYKVYPGHGKPTTIAHEMKHNPFVKI
ncbi:MAG: MBL fold metallo-hydrolase [Cytophagales bacterium]|nr:MBL fold metallo-hydrolase [Cytophagales bacterium]